MFNSMFSHGEPDTWFRDGHQAYTKWIQASKEPVEETLLLELTLQKLLHRLETRMRQLRLSTYEELKEEVIFRTSVSRNLSKNPPNQTRVERNRVNGMSSIPLSAVGVTKESITRETAGCSRRMRSVGSWSPTTGGYWSGGRRYRSMDGKYRLSWTQDVPRPLYTPGASTKKNTWDGAFPTRQLQLKDLLCHCECGV